MLQRAAPGRPGAVSAAPPLLWLDDPRDVSANMARDAELLERAIHGRLPGTVLRLYTFAPPGITLGRAQDPERELDLAALARDGVRWAVRPTGGRAIWHDQEWTFALATRLGVDGWAETPGAAYERTARLLVAALQALGVHASLAPGTPRGPGAPRAAEGAAPPCFASSARFELVLGGRKLAGIAQRASRGALLQQGSLLLGESHLTLARYLRAASDSRPELARDWREHAAAAGEHLGDDWSLARLAGALGDALGGTTPLRAGMGTARPGPSD